MDYTSLHEDHPHVVARNARHGMTLFVVYVFLYIGFVVLNIFVPDTMGAEVLGGVNLAVAYGVGLIIAALILALVYTWLCRSGGGQAPEAETENS